MTSPEQLQPIEEMRAGESPETSASINPRETPLEMADQRLTRKLTQSVVEIKKAVESGQKTEAEGQLMLGQLDQLAVELVGIPTSELGASLEAAKEIMGPNYLFGPEEIKKAFDIEVSSEDVPNIPFSLAELERAKELGMILVLRIDKNKTGGPLIITDLTGPEAALDDFRMPGEVKTQSPRVGWTFLSNKINLGNYYEQSNSSAIDIEHFFTNMTKTEKIPTIYQEALDEYDQYLETNFGGKGPAEVFDLLMASPKKYNVELSQLKLNQLCRQTPVELYYDLQLYYRNTKRMLLQYSDIYTSTLNRHDEMIIVHEPSAGYPRLYFKGINDFRDGDGTIFTLPSWPKETK